MMSKPEHHEGMRGGAKRLVGGPDRELKRVMCPGGWMTGLSCVSRHRTKFCLLKVRRVSHCPK